MKAFHQKALTDDYEETPIVSFLGDPSELRSLAQFIQEFAEQAGSGGEDASGNPHSHFIDWQKKQGISLGIDVICVAEMGGQSS